LNNLFREKWKALEAEGPPPRRLREVKTIGFEQFRSDVLGQDPAFVDFVTQSIYSGDSWILSNVFPPETLVNLKQRAYEYGQAVEQGYHRILDGCPDNHNAVDQPSGPPGGYVAIDHSYYFFRWNNDPLGLFDLVKTLWTTIKFLGGYEFDQYEKNIPSDGVIDRIQIHHYPRGAGKITTHSDPFNNQKVIAGAMLTEPGKDYKAGGFYILDKANQKSLFEDQISLGSVVIAHPALLHGVETIDPGLESDWSSIAGRWYMSVFSIDSHCVANRTTALPPESVSLATT
jgi:hypothetical protein